MVLLLKKTIRVKGRVTFFNQNNELIMVDRQTGQAKLIRLYLKSKINKLDFTSADIMRDGSFCKILYPTDLINLLSTTEMQLYFHSLIKGQGSTDIVPVSLNDNPYLLIGWFNTH
jgi:hypothetical protein